MTFVFALTSLVRFLKQRESPAIALARKTVAQQIEPQGTTAEIQISDLDRELVSTSFSAETADNITSAPDAWSLDLIHRIEWKRFEDLCCEFHREKGIRADTTRLGADDGVDIRLYQDDAYPSMTARDGARGRFWGCVTYPRCRTTLLMRATSA